MTADSVAPAPAGDRPVDRLPAREDLPPTGSAVHLVGVGGAGMRGLAVLLAHEGYRVSGCDRAGVADPTDLERAEVAVQAGHDPAHAEGQRLLVRSSAVPADAEELTAAREAGVPVASRARVLGALLNGRRLVGVAGTHGKTTITAMAGVACQAAGLDPAVAAGGRMAAWDGYARPGAGRPALVEADEYDRSFLALDPSLAVVSSIEPEHLDTYGTEEALREAFLAFARRASGRDGVLYCVDEPGARALTEELEGAVGYGLGLGATYRAEVLPPEEDVSAETSAAGQRCRLTWPGGQVSFGLTVPGDHNVQNAAAALACALRLGADPEVAAAALADFAGVERRLETLAERGGVRVVDDYAHHPTEVRASMAALRRRWPEARLVAVFQPHLYTRTRDFAPQFAAALAEADRALVLPIYPAREAPIEGVNAGLIVEAGGVDVRQGDREAALEAVRRALQAAPARETVLLFMGAGDVTELAGRAAALVAGGDGSDALGA